MDHPLNPPFDFSQIMSMAIPSPSTKALSDQCAFMPILVMVVAVGGGELVSGVGVGCEWFDVTDALGPKPPTTGVEPFECTITGMMAVALGTLKHSRVRAAS